MGGPADTGTGDPTDLRPRPGDLVDHRYRLRELLQVTDAGHSDGGALWRAEDEVLHRPVALRLLTGAGVDTRRAFLAAGIAGGRTSDPFIAATYDAAELPRLDTVAGPPGADGANTRSDAYVVREWVEGSTLRDVLRDGPLDPEQATVIVRDVALAVAHLHDAGLVHGRLHPGNVFLRPDGQVRLSDSGVGDVLDHGRGAAHAPGPDDDPGRTDVVGLGSTLYAALTARWPSTSWRGLPAAPRSTTDGRPLPPRQVRAGVPKELDAIVGRILLLDRRPDEAPLRTAAAIAAALSPLPMEPAGPAPALPAAHRATRRRPRRRIALLITAVVLGVGGWLVAQSAGRSPSRSSDVPAFTAIPDTPAPAAPARTVVIAGVTSFDPPPGDGTENEDLTAAAHDGNSATGWQTQTYRTAALGNAKPGVGLLVDLGAARKITEVDLTFLRAGTDVELRAAAANTTAPGSKLADFPVLGHKDDAGTSISFRTATTSRYWLVWLTRLPPSPRGFRGSIAEMTFRD